MTKADWLAQFRLQYSKWDTLTDTVIYTWMDIANAMLPNAFTTNCATANQTSLMFVLNLMVAHLLSYNQVLENPDGSVYLTKNQSSMSADGLSIGYESMAKLHGDKFASLNDFLNITPYGRQVAVFLDKLAIPAGGFLV